MVSKIFCCFTVVVFGYGLNCDTVYLTLNNSLNRIESLIKIIDPFMIKFISENKFKSL